jgi:hypothetical protein
VEAALCRLFMLCVVPILLDIRASKSKQSSLQHNLYSYCSYIVPAHWNCGLLQTAPCIKQS